MAKNSGKARMWRKLDTLAKYLKDIGLDKFEIDVSNYDPSQKSLRRPDSANKLKRTHSAANQGLDKGIRTNLHSDIDIRTNDTEQGLKKLTATDIAIEKAKERWEERRAKILQEENPRAR